MFHSKWVIIDCKKRGDIMDIYKRIYELENEIAALPQGSINMKKIYGKEQPYLQWTENGKSKSKYIKKNEREEIFAGVERRKQLQEELKELKQHSSIDPSKSTDFETSVIIGERLLALTKGVKNWGKRDCFRQLQAYLNSEETDRVCLVFGLRLDVGFAYDGDADRCLCVPNTLLLPFMICIIPKMIASRAVT